MEKIWLIPFLLLLMPMSLAQSVPEKPSFPPVSWVSKDSSDEITIQNGSGAALVIQITVINNQNSSAPGIDIKNCGKTTHINAGSSAICSTHDAALPVSFSSDSHDRAAGMYQIKQE